MSEYGNVRTFLKQKMSESFKNMQGYVLKCRIQEFLNCSLDLLLFCSFQSFPAEGIRRRPAGHSQNWAQLGHFFLRPSRIRVDLLPYESKPTDKREQNDERAEKKLDGKL